MAQFAETWPESGLVETGFVETGSVEIVGTEAGSVGTGGGLVHVCGFSESPLAGGRQEVI